MSARKPSRAATALIVVFVLLGAGGLISLRSMGGLSKTTLVAYFENTNGIYAGDEITMLGVPVGKIVAIDPQPERVKVSFWVDSQHRVPEEVNALILSPSLVSARVIELSPAYESGPVLQDGDVIPQRRTAVPMEYDDLRQQLEKLSETMQPTEPGGSSTLGTFVSTAADNLRGNGGAVRESLREVSQMFSALGDHSKDIFGTLKNLATLVRALESSTDLMEGLNYDLSSVTTLLANDPGEISNAVRELNGVVRLAETFAADNREAVGTTSDILASTTDALVESIGDIKQVLHIAPTTFQNFNNIYEPANGAFTGVLAATNFADPIGFLCGAVQAASRLGAEQSAKLCVQYLAPIIKNRQYNYPPIGFSALNGAQARPNEVTFSEDWLRPQTEAGRIRDFYEGPLPTPAPEGAGTGTDPATADGAGPHLAAEATPTDPAAGLQGMLVPEESEPK